MTHVDHTAETCLIILYISHGYKQLPKISTQSKINVFLIFSFTRDPSLTTSLSQEPWQKKAQAILEALMKHRDSVNFLAPVDWELLSIPDYPKVTPSKNFLKINHYLEHLMRCRSLPTLWILAPSRINSNRDTTVARRCLSKVAVEFCLFFRLAQNFRHTCSSLLPEP